MTDKKDSLKALDLVELDGDENFLKYWTLSFSPRQFCFHVFPLGEMLKGNVDMLVSRSWDEAKKPIARDWVIVGVSKNFDQLASIKRRLQGRWSRTKIYTSEELLELEKEVVKIRTERKSQESDYEFDQKQKFYDDSYDAQNNPDQDLPILGDREHDD